MKPVSLDHGRRPFLWRLLAAGVLACWLAVPWLPGRAAGPPSRIVLGFAADPATSQAVTWRTLDRAPSPSTQIAVESAGAGASATARSITASSSAVTLHTGQVVYHHAATFSSLQPATRYRYRVGDGTTWSGWQSFSTASTQPAPFQFIYLGDAQNGLADAWPPVVKAARRAAPDARLMVHAGDLVAEGYDDQLWAQWIAGLGPLAATVPHIAVPGNHDEHRPPGSADADLVFAVSPLWRAHFRFPANGPTDLPDLSSQFYTVDYQGVRFVALDANPFANHSYVEAQRLRVQKAVLAWLENVLKNNPNRWTIVVQHQPLYPVAKERDFPEMRAALGAVYDKYHVDLVLQGHDHSYARTHPVAGGKLAPAGQFGTVYTIAVSGSKMYAVTRPWKPLMARLAENTQSFQIVSVSRDRLDYTSHAVDGMVLDRFELKKTGARTDYVDHARDLVR